jgi:hypothetical protein
MPSDSSALHGDGEASVVGNASACRWRGDHRMGELIRVRGRKGLASGACTLQCAWAQSLSGVASGAGVLDSFLSNIGW